MGKGAWDCDSNSEIPPEKEVRLLSYSAVCSSRCCSLAHVTKVFPWFALHLIKAEVFEEVATMDHAFEGIPTVPPRKDTTHMAAYCNGCRYRVTADPSMTVAQVGGDDCILTVGRLRCFKHCVVGLNAGTTACCLCVCL